jgi:hypothetical protein
MLSAREIIDLNTTDPAAARKEALGLLDKVEGRIASARPGDELGDDDAVLQLVSAGILTNDDIADHDAEVAEREHRAERRETGVSTRDVLRGKGKR